MQDNDGNTPLHYACKTKDVACLSLLYSYGASATIQNNEGQVPSWTVFSTVEAMVFKGCNPFVEIGLYKNEEDKAVGFVKRAWKVLSPANFKKLQICAKSSNYTSTDRLCILIDALMYDEAPIPTVSLP